MFNQDQIIWTLALIEGILGVLLGLSGVLGPEASKWVTIVHSIIAFIAAFCRQSPFPKTPWTPAQRAAYVNDGISPDTSKPAAPVVGLLLLAALGAGVVTCAPKMLVLTPQGQVAYTATEIGKRVGELGDAAIGASKAGVSDKITVPIVLFSYHTLKVLETAPAGWQQTVVAAWAALKATVPAPANPVLLATWTAVDVILSAFQPSTPDVPKIDPATLERLETWLSAQGEL